MLLLAKDGVAQWFLGHLGLEGALNALLTVPAVGGNTLSTSGLGRDVYKRQVGGHRRQRGH